MMFNHYSLIVIEISIIITLEIIFSWNLFVFYFICNLDSPEKENPPDKPPAGMHIQYSSTNEKPLNYKF